MACSEMKQAIFYILFSTQFQELAYTIQLLDDREDEES